MACGCIRSCVTNKQEVVTALCHDTKRRAACASALMHIHDQAEDLAPASCGVSSDGPLLSLHFNTKGVVVSDHYHNLPYKHSTHRLCKPSYISTKQVHNLLQPWAKTPNVSKPSSRTYRTANSLASSHPADRFTKTMIFAWICKAFCCSHFSLVSNH